MTKSKNAKKAGARAHASPASSSHNASPSKESDTAPPSDKNSSAFSKLPAPIRFLLKVIFVVVLFITFINGVRWCCCVSFSLFRFACTLYTNTVAASQEGTGISPWSAEGFEHYMSEVFEWWAGVQQCVARY